MIVKRNTNNTAASAANGWTVSGSVGIAQGPKGEKGDKGDSGDVIQQEILDDLQQQIENSKNFETDWGNLAAISSQVSLTVGTHNLMKLQGDIWEDKIYFMGGRLSTGFTCEVFIYDITSDSWSKGTSSNPARLAEGVACVAHEGKIYCLGGGQLSNFYNKYLSIYDIATATWEDKPDFSFDCMWSAVCVVENKIYIHGGYSGSTMSNKLFCYDIAEENWTELAATTMQTASHHMYEYNNFIYVVVNGGSRIMKYDIANNTWNEDFFVNSAYSKTFAECCKFGNKIMIIGAGESELARDNLFIYDLETETYSTLPFPSLIVWGLDGFIAAKDNTFYKFFRSEGFKFNISENVAVQQVRGTSADIAGTKGLEGQIAINTEKNTLVIFDGATAGGHEIGDVDLSAHATKEEVETKLSDIKKETSTLTKIVNSRLKNVDGLIVFDGTNWSIGDGATNIISVTYDTATNVLTVNHNSLKGFNVHLTPLGAIELPVITEINPNNTKLTFNAEQTTAISFAFTRMHTAPLKEEIHEFIQPELVSSAGKIFYHKFTESCEAEFEAFAGMGGNATGYLIENRPWAKGRPADAIKFRYNFKADDEIMILPGCRAWDAGIDGNKSSDGNSGAGGGGTYIIKIRRDLTAADLNNTNYAKGIYSISKSHPNFPVELGNNFSVIIQALGIVCGGAGGRDGNYGTPNDNIFNSTELFKPTELYSWEQREVNGANSGGFIYNHTATDDGRSFINGGATK